MGQIYGVLNPGGTPAPQKRFFRVGRQKRQAARPGATALKPAASCLELAARAHSATHHARLRLCHEGSLALAGVPGFGFFGAGPSAGGLEVGGRIRNP
jgi:hypothetical protein